MFIRNLTAASLMMSAHLIATGAQADTWYPASVYEWKPAFNTEDAREKTDYIPIDGEAQKKWRICASIPHLKDAYWLGVNYGMVEEAEARQVSLSLFEAGGYDRLDVQISQIEKCLSDGMDALIVSSVTLDGTNDVLSRVHAENIPIIDLINGTSFPHLSARSAADYFDNGYAAGRFLVDKHKDSDFDVTVLWFPGPKTAGWAMRGDKGFKEAIEGTNVKLLETKYGDPVKKIQGELVSEALKTYPDIDYIVGSTVTAEAATSIVRRKRIKDRTNVMAYYFGPGVHRGILRGSIIAAPSDKQAIQARIAVDQAIRILEDKPLQKHVGPVIEVVDPSNLDSFDLTTSLAPRGFKAIFDVN